MAINNDITLAEQIAQKANEFGGKVYYVGGYVRDGLLGIPNKDIDIEVHNISVENLEKILNGVGEWFIKGVSFGVYGINGSEIDIALPRTELAVGQGHKDFKIDVNPFVGELDAAKRRDLTINSMMENVLTHEIVDNYNGRQDLKDKVLRYVNKDSFSEDQLRVLRTAQFASRFEFSVSKELMEKCRSMSLNALPRERVFEELKKALLKSNKPSIFFEVLREMNQLSFWFEELEQLIGLGQNEKYHAEGDVWNHTMLVIDEAAKYRDKVTNPIAFMITALMHDYGKIVSTFVKDGVIHSYNHEIEGLPLVKKALKRITDDKSIERYVLNMVKLHMKPNIVANAKSQIKTTNKMFYDSVAPLDLIYFSFADHGGRIKQIEDNNNEAFLFERYSVFEEMMKEPFVTGDDLIKNGITQGEQIGILLEYATKLRLAGIKKDDALKQALAMSKKKK